MDEPEPPGSGPEDGEILEENEVHEAASFSTSRRDGNVAGEYPPRKGQRLHVKQRLGRRDTHFSGRGGAHVRNPCFNGRYPPPRRRSSSAGRPESPPAARYYNNGRQRRSDDDGLGKTEMLRNPNRWTNSGSFNFNSQNRFRAKRDRSSVDAHSQPDASTYAGGAPGVTQRGRSHNATRSRPTSDEERRNSSLNPTVDEAYQSQARACRSQEPGSSGSPSHSNSSSVLPSSSRNTAGAINKPEAADGRASDSALDNFSCNKPGATSGCAAEEPPRDKVDETGIENISEHEDSSVSSSSIVSLPVENKTPPPIIILSSTESSDTSLDEAAIAAYYGEGYISMSDVKHVMSTQGSQGAGTSLPATSQLNLPAVTISEEDLLHVEVVDVASNSSGDEEENSKDNLNVQSQNEKLDDATGEIIPSVSDAQSVELHGESEKLNLHCPENTEGTAGVNSETESRNDHNEHNSDEEIEVLQLRNDLLSQMMAKMQDEDSQSTIKTDKVEIQPVDDIPLNVSVPPSRSCDEDNEESLRAELLEQIKKNRETKRPDVRDENLPGSDWGDGGDGPSTRHSMNHDKPIRRFHYEPPATHTRGYERGRSGRRYRRTSFSSSTGFQSNTGQHGYKKSKNLTRRGLGQRRNSSKYSTLPRRSLSRGSYRGGGNRRMSSPRRDTPSRSPSPPPHPTSPSPPPHATSPSPPPHATSPSPPPHATSPSPPPHVTSPSPPPVVPTTTQPDVQRIVTLRDEPLTNLTLSTSSTCQRRLSSTFNLSDNDLRKKLMTIASRKERHGVHEVPQNMTITRTVNFPENTTQASTVRLKSPPLEVTRTIQIEIPCEDTDSGNEEENKESSVENVKNQPEPKPELPKGHEEEEVVGQPITTIGSFSRTHDSTSSYEPPSDQEFPASQTQTDSLHNLELVSAEDTSHSSSFQSSDRQESNYDLRLSTSRFAENGPMYVGASPGPISPSLCRSYLSEPIMSVPGYSRSDFSHAEGGRPFPGPMVLRFPPELPQVLPNITQITRSSFQSGEILPRFLPFPAIPDFRSADGPRNRLHGTYSEGMRFTNYQMSHPGGNIIFQHTSVNSIAGMGPLPFGICSSGITMPLVSAYEGYNENFEVHPEASERSSPSDEYPRRGTGWRGRGRRGRSFRCPSRHKQYAKPKCKGTGRSSASNRRSAPPEEVKSSTSTVSPPTQTQSQTGSSTSTSTLVPTNADQPSTSKKIASMGKKSLSIPNVSTELENFEPDLIPAGRSSSLPPNQNRVVVGQTKCSHAASPSSESGVGAPTTNTYPSATDTACTGSSTPPSLAPSGFKEAKQADAQDADSISAASTPQLQTPPAGVSNTELSETTSMTSNSPPVQQSPETSQKRKSPTAATSTNDYLLSSPASPSKDTPPDGESQDEEDDTMQGLPLAEDQHLSGETYSNSQEDPRSSPHEPTASPEPGSEEPPLQQIVFTDTENLAPATVDLQTFEDALQKSNAIPAKIPCGNVMQCSHSNTRSPQLGSRASLTPTISERLSAVHQSESTEKVSANRYVPGAPQVRKPGVPMRLIVPVREDDTTSSEETEEEGTKGADPEDTTPQNQDKTSTSNDEGETNKNGGEAGDVDWEGRVIEFLKEKRQEVERMKSTVAVSGHASNPQQSSTENSTLPVTSPVIVSPPSTSETGPSQIAAPQIDKSTTVTPQVSKLATFSVPTSQNKPVTISAFRNLKLHAARKTARFPVTSSTTQPSTVLSLAERVAAAVAGKLRTPLRTNLTKSTSLSSLDKRPETTAAGSSSSLKRPGSPLLTAASKKQATSAASSKEIDRSSSAPGTSLVSTSKAIIDELTIKITESRDQLALSTKERELLHSRQSCFDELRDIQRNLQQHTKLTTLDDKIQVTINQLQKKLDGMKSRQKDVRSKATDMNKLIREKSSAFLPKAQRCLIVSKKVRQMGENIMGKNKYKMADLFSKDLSTVVKSMRTFNSRQHQSLQTERGPAFKYIMGSWIDHITDPPKSILGNNTPGNSGKGPVKIGENVASPDESPQASADQDGGSVENNQVYLTRHALGKDARDLYQEKLVDYTPDRLPLQPDDVLGVTKCRETTGCYSWAELLSLVGSSKEEGNSVTLDPMVVLCPLSISKGICMRENCAFQHI